MNFARRRPPFRLPPPHFDLPTQVGVIHDSPWTRRRRRRAFTLVEMAICLAIIAALAYMVRAFHEPSTQKALRVQAQQEMVRLRDRASIALSRSPNVKILRLDQILKEGETGEDPWGRPYVLEPGKRLICLGANGRIDIEGERRPDDMEEPLPPNPVEVQATPNKDVSNPIIDPVGPIGVCKELRPVFWARYKDGGSGISPSTAKLTLDGSVLASTASETEVRGKPGSDLKSGMHLLGVEVQDKAGNRSLRQWNVMTP